MSEIALQSGFYEELREYAELVDNVLVELKTQLSPNKHNCEQLGAMLVELRTDEWQVSPARFFVILLSDFSKRGRIEWAKIGGSLLSGQISREAVAKLENLAAALEQEQISVMARLRGL